MLAVTEDPVVGFRNIIPKTAKSVSSYQRS
jgi:hypothetical protein